MKTLEELISFKHPQVIRRFAKEFPEYALHAEEIFQDLMRFFWAGRMHEHDRKMNPQDESLNFIYIMDEEMKSIDLMWHIFLLYTKDYMNFCQEYFGEYLHHLPDVVEKLEDDVTKFEDNLGKFLSYTYDRLGEDVIRRWYAAYV